MATLSSLDSIQTRIRAQQEVSRAQKLKFEWRHKYVDLQSRANNHWKCIQRIVSFADPEKWVIFNQDTLEQWKYAHQLQFMIQNLQDTFQPLKNCIIEENNMESLANQLLSTREGMHQEWILLEEDQGRIEKELHDFLNICFSTKAKQEQVDCKEKPTPAYAIELDSVSQNEKHQVSSKDNIFSLLQLHYLGDESSSCKNLIRHQKAKERVESQNNARNKNVLEKTQRLVYQNRSKEQCDKILFMKHIHECDASDEKRSEKIIKENKDDWNKKYDDTSKKISLISHKLLQVQRTDQAIGSAARKKHKDEIETLLQMDAAKERVDTRYEKLKQKKFTEEKALEKVAELESRKYQRLKDLAESVPYHMNIVHKKADIFKTTKARTNGVYQPGDEQHESRFSFQHGVPVSFSEDRCFSDFKFKLTHALHEAGIARSSYSRSIVKQLIPREKERTTGIEPF